MEFIPTDKILTVDTESFVTQNFCMGIFDCFLFNT